MSGGMKKKAPSVDPRALAASLDGIADLGDEDQCERLEQAAAALYDFPTLDLTLVRAALGVLERCGAQDDLGMFHTLQCYLEHHCEDKRVQEAVQGSVRRAPSWKTIEILPSFAGVEGSVRLLEMIQREKKFNDPRYDASWLAEQIDDLRKELTR